MPGAGHANSARGRANRARGGPKGPLGGPGDAAAGRSGVAAASGAPERVVEGGGLSPGRAGAGGGAAAVRSGWWARDRVSRGRGRGHRFSAFWLRSSVVSVLISLISDTSSMRGLYIKRIFGLGSWIRSLLPPLRASSRYCSTSGNGAPPSGGCCGCRKTELAGVRRGNASLPRRGAGRGGAGQRPGSCRPAAAGGEGAPQGSWLRGGQVAAQRVRSLPPSLPLPRGGTALCSLALLAAHAVPSRWVSGRLRRPGQQVTHCGRAGGRAAGRGGAGSTVPKGCF